MQLCLAVTLYVHCVSCSTIRQKDNIIIGLREVGCKGINWTGSGQDLCLVIMFGISSVHHVVYVSCSTT
jgi:hypothetical protein